MMDAYQAYDQDLRGCVKCAEILAGKCVDPSVGDEAVIPKPLLMGVKPKPIMLIGQAPGITEYRSGKPFQGQAGQGVRQIFAELGVGDFDAQVWSTAVVKCYPGRKRVKNSRTGGYRVEDELPSVAMVRNCQPFLQRQIDLVQPRIIVTLGGFPLKAYLRLRGRPANEGVLEDFVGKCERWHDRSMHFFPHTSGSSRWLNSQVNKQLFEKAKQSLRKTLIEAELITQL